MTRFKRLSAALGFLTALVVAPTAGHAVLFEYDYRGPDFQTAVPPYTTSDFVGVWFSIELPLNTNLPFEDYARFVQAFTFSDGVQTITQDDATDDLLFQFQTDGQGDITSWLVRATIGERTISTFFEFNNLMDNAQIDAATTAFVNLPGSNQADNWTQGAKVPEPAALGLFLVALLTLGALSRGPRKHRSLAS